MSNIAPLLLRDQNLRSVAQKCPATRHFHCESDSNSVDLCTKDSVLLNSCCVSSGAASNGVSLWSSDEQLSKKITNGRDAAAQKQNESAYQTYIKDLTGKRRFTPPNEALVETQQLMMRLRTTPSRVATPSTPPRASMLLSRHLTAATTATTTTMSAAPNDLAASRSAERVDRRGQRPNKRQVANVLAYWLSLCYESECRAPAVSILPLPHAPAAFVPPYLRNGAFLRSKLHDMCWQCGGCAHDYVGALAIVDKMDAQSDPAHLQLALRAFINALGSVAVHEFFDRQKLWPSLLQRYQITMQDSNCSILERLRAMSDAVAQI
jgi:hypothetical protein